MSRNKRVKSPAALKKAAAKRSLRRAEAEAIKNVASAADLVGNCASIDTIEKGVGLWLRVQKLLRSPALCAKLQEEGAAWFSERGVIECESISEVLARIPFAASSILSPGLVAAGLKRVGKLGGILEYRGEADVETVRAMVEPHGGQVYELPPFAPNEHPNEREENPSHSTASDGPSTGTSADAEPSQDVPQADETLTDLLARALGDMPIISHQADEESSGADAEAETMTTLDDVAITTAPTADLSDQPQPTSAEPSHVVSSTSKPLGDFSPASRHAGVAGPRPFPPLPRHGGKPEQLNR